VLELRLPAAVLVRVVDLEEHYVITIGIDPHKSSHTAVASTRAASRSASCACWPTTERWPG
jgi:hypothetical protein